MKMNNRGMTLVEILVTVGIVAILTVAVGFQFAGWKARYEVEKAIRDLYSSLSDARTRAMQTSRAHFFDISPDGRHYRVTDDDSNGVLKVANGDGVFTQQSAWAAIQVSRPLNWGAVAVTTDTTLAQLSRRIELTTNPGGATAAARLAGLLSTRLVAPNSGNSFVLGFDKRGIIRDMRGLPAAVIDINAPLNFPQTYGLSICIFTDYNNDGISDSDPDYDCINIRESKISLGKLQMQNTDPALVGGLEPCVNTMSSAGVAQQVGGRSYGCLSK